MEYNFKRLALSLAAKQLNQDTITNINKEKWWQLQGGSPNYFILTQTEIKISLQKYSDYLK